MSRRAGVTTLLFAAALGACDRAPPVTAAELAGGYRFSYGPAVDRLVLCADGSWHHRYARPSSPAMEQAGRWELAGVSDDDPRVVFEGYVPRWKEDEPALARRPAAGSPMPAGSGFSSMLVERGAARRPRLIASLEQDRAYVRLPDDESASMIAGACALQAPAADRSRGDLHPPSQP